MAGDVLVFEEKEQANDRPDERPKRLR